MFSFDEYNNWEMRQYIKEFCHIETHNPLDFSRIDLSGPDTPHHRSNCQYKAASKRSGEPDT